MEVTGGWICLSSLSSSGVRYRSIVGSLLQAPWALGYALLALVAYLSKSWDTIQMVTVVMHLLSIALLHLLPESPRYFTFPILSKLQMADYDGQGQGRGADHKESVSNEPEDTSLGPGTGSPCGETEAAEGRSTAIVYSSLQDQRAPTSLRDPFSYLGGSKRERRTATFR